MNINWCLYENSYNGELIKYYEGLMTQGNGYLHVRGSYEEGISGAVQDEEYDRKPANVTLEKHKKQKSKWGTYIPGIVGPHPYLKTETINLPYIFDLKVNADGEELDMENCQIEKYERYLNLLDGILTRSFTWKTNKGKVLKLTFSRMISMADKHIAVQTLTIKAESGDINIVVTGDINTGVRTNGFNHFTRIKKEKQDDITRVITETNGGNTITMCSYLDCEGENVIQQGEQLKITKIIQVSTDRDEEIEALKETKEDIRTLDLDRLVERHRLKWTEKWRAADIVITGDNHAQLAIRMAIYHLIRADNEDDPRVAICAKGHAGEGYCGRYFWDTEINILPFFIHTNPKAARNLVKFRYMTLSGAKENAKNYGYKGARYAWESSVTGIEECANWQYADHEIHVTADIIYAMEHYVKATKDVGFIEECGLEMMKETAEYWAERVDEIDGQYQLLGVMGPDEYLPMTRNNAFTNRMVKFSLEKTVQYLSETNQGQKDQLKKWETIKERLRLPYKETDELIMQSDDFASYADVNFDEIWKDRSRYFGEFISQEKNYRSKALKQADVLEMMLLFPEEFTEKQLIANYDYYEPITTHDSSLSAAVHGILAARMGRVKEAERFLDKVIDIDMCPDKCGAEEGIHIANCGGLWQLIVYGFAGLKSAMWEDNIVLNPCLPREWQQVEIPIMWHGERKRVVVTHEGYNIN
ncbi:kojibiose phosphorylase [Mobilisporobacter senegalensis]|uniref:Kojibiose phosphorylase n=1 Tax=Mobilisporobacter senegalensis TaxID=1329262 RepID=A0A3N1XNG5_9FIRM|nr:glycosyl hydrolase family 65 protein [Mobilisporobacter senegalensis]ROR28229.1 kojibiose phosphorylase [Mobilisporobacter senegalensis]